MNPLPIWPNPDEDRYMANVSAPWKTDEEIAEYTATGFVKGFPDSYKTCGEGGGDFGFRAPPSFVLDGNWLRRVQNLTPDCTYRVDFAIASIPRFLEQYAVNLDPDYQRGHVWTKEQKRKFVGSVLQNHHAVPIFWFNRPIDHGPSEVVDGKQRLTAIMGWLNGDYSAICPCGEEFAFADVDEIGERNLSMMITLKMHFVKLSRPDVLRFYLSLNSGGTVHTTREINRVKALLENA